MTKVRVSKLQSNEQARIARDISGFAAGADGEAVPVLLLMVNVVVLPAKDIEKSVTEGLVGSERQPGTTANRTAKEGQLPTL